MITILIQGDTKIVSVEEIEEVRKDEKCTLQGVKENGDKIELGIYEEPYRSGGVMLYITKRFNENPDSIIRLPEDDADLDRNIEDWDY